MSNKVVRIERVSFDELCSSFNAVLTFAAPSGPVVKQVRVSGHRRWGAAEITQALKQAARQFTTS